VADHCSGHRHAGQRQSVGNPAPRMPGALAVNRRWSRADRSARLRACACRAEEVGLAPGDHDVGSRPSWRAWVTASARLLTWSLR
jgi:hypothetical protein